MTRDDTPIQGEAEDVITLRRKEIPVKTGYVKHAGLRFYPENPRIYSTVWKEDGVEPSQPEIFEALARTEHVREVLVPSIRHNGGLIEPVLIKKNIVLEGNSRLAAYRLLAQVDPDRWELIRVRIVPDSITESEVFSLLGEYHIVGKKDWQPFEQAGYLYRRFRTHGVTEDDLRTEVGLGLGKIRHFIRVYDFMVRHNDRNPNRWSYYDELLKGRRFNKARELYPNFDEIILQRMNSREIERAVDLRDELPLITKAGGNTLKKFMSGAYSFEEAVADAKHRGAGDHNVRRLTQFRKWLAEEQIDQEFSAAVKADRKNLLYELEKLSSRIGSLLRRVKASPEEG
jgi:hypothetical protein